MIDLKKYPNNISMLFSGGAESSLLYYLLASKIENKNLTLYVIDRYNKPIEHATKIFNLINKKLNYQNSDLKILPLPKIVQRYEIKFATCLLQNKHNVLFLGFNKYPEDETIRPKYIGNFEETDFIKIPFKNLEKDKIIKMYFDLGIEDILYQTHSCGLNLHYPCKECFNCRERAWAYKKLNLPVEYGN